MNPKRTWFNTQAVSVLMCVSSGLRGGGLGLPRGAAHAYSVDVLLRPLVADYSPLCGQVGPGDRAG